MEQRNLNFLFDSMEKMGAGVSKYYQQAILDGIKSRVPDIPLETIVFDFDKATHEKLQVTPRVIELSPDFYVFKGYQAKLVQDGMEPKEHFFTSFQMAVFNVDKARNLLQGGSVLNTIKDENDIRQKRYTQLDLDSPKLESGNYRQINTYERDFNLIRTLSDMPDIPGKKKQEVVEKLQNGERVPVEITGNDRKKESVEFMIDARNKAVNLIDSTGQVIPFSVVEKRNFELLHSVKDDGKKKDEKPKLNPLASKALTHGSKDKKKEPSRKVS